MKFSSDASPLFFLCGDQTPSKLNPGLFQLLAICNIEATSDITGKAIVHQKTRGSEAYYPSIESIGPPKAIFNGELPVGVKCCDVGLIEALQVVVMNVFRPS